MKFDKLRRFKNSIKHLEDERNKLKNICKFVVKF